MRHSGEEDAPKGELTHVTWDFFQRYDDSWIWRCVDNHNITESSRNFAAFDECVADAARHGYVPQDVRSKASRDSHPSRTKSSPRRRDIVKN